MVRGKLLMKMHLRTILQNAGEATWLVVLEGGYKDFLNSPFHPRQSQPLLGAVEARWRDSWAGKAPGGGNASCQDLPVEIYPLSVNCPSSHGEGPRRVHSDNLHPFSSVTLFVAVLADHVQLSDSVLQNTRMQTGQPHHSLLKTTPPNYGAASNSWSALPAEKESRHVGLMLVFLRILKELIVIRMQKRLVPRTFCITLANVHQGADGLQGLEPILLTHG